MRIIYRERGDDDQARTSSSMPIIAAIIRRRSIIHTPMPLESRRMQEIVVALIITFWKTFQDKVDFTAEFSTIEV
jgi:hypothetical protein